MSKLRKRMASSLITAALLAQMLPMSVLAAEPTVSPTDLPATAQEEVSTADLTADSVPAPSSVREVIEKWTEPSYLGSSDLMQSGSIGSIQYELTKSGMLTLSGSGAMKDWDYSSKAPWYDNRYYVRSVQIGDGITSIGNYAFDGCSSVTSVSIPDSVTSIGEFAFSGCKFESFVLPDGVSTLGFGAFSNCSKLTAIAIPDAVTVIPNKTFYYCQSLHDVTLPASLTTVNYQAFYGCEKLETIDLPDSVTTIGSNAFEASGLTSIAIPNAVTAIARETFKECKSLTSVQLPQTLTSIGSRAFDRCGSLSAITIPDTVATIGDGAFSGCTSLANVTIPAAVTSLGNNVFSGSGLTEVTVPASVTSIASSAFSACKQLAAIHVSEGNSAYTSVDGILYNKAATELITCPAGKASVNSLSDTITVIGGGSFAGCAQLTSVTIPVSVTSIGDNAFDGCNSLSDVWYQGNAGQWKSVIGYYNDTLTKAALHTAEGTVLDAGSCGENATYTLSTEGMFTVSGIGAMTSYSEDEYTPWYGLRNYIKSVQIEEGITSIGKRTFCECRYLSGVSLPDSVKAIGEYAFCQCHALKSIAFPDTLTYIGESAFEDSAIQTVVLPDSIVWMGQLAFAGCSARSVIIPASVTYIPTGLFEGSSFLRDIYYKGTEEEWKKVRIESDNRTFSYVVRTYGVHYNYGVTIIEGQCGENLYFALNGDVLVISGTGDMYDFAQDGSDCPWKDVASSIRSIRLENGVASVGANAFRGLTNLDSVTVSDTVTAIGSGAFQGCNNTKFNTVALPSVTVIGDSAFQGCSYLITVVMDSTVTIGDYAFADAYLKRVVPSETAGTEDNYGMMDLPESVVSIGEGAFQKTRLETFSIPKSVTFIGTNAFDGGMGSSFIVDPENTVYASRDGVLYDKNFRTLLKCPRRIEAVPTIPETVTAIADRAFYNAFSGYNSFTLSLPKSVISIGKNALDCGSSISAFSVDAENPAFASSDGILYDKDCRTLLKIPAGKNSLSEMPDTVTAIAEDAFSCANKLKSITVSRSVTSVGKDAFPSTLTFTDVYFDGSEYDWSKIVIDVGNDALTGATIHYAGYDVTVNVNQAASKLYEPWGIRFYAEFTGSDTDCIAHHGMVILKDTDYTEGMTQEEFRTHVNAHVYLDGQLDNSSDGEFIATLEEGIYSYDITANYYVMPYAVLKNGETVYGRIKHSSMEYILRNNQRSGSVSAEEKAICSCILALRESVAAHYAQESIPGASPALVIPRGTSQTAAASVRTAQESGVTPNIYAGASRMIEPWGLRYYADFGTSETISERGVVILHQADYQTAFADSPDAMRCCDHAFVFRDSDGTLIENGGSTYFATVTDGISSRNIGDLYYVVPFAVLTDGSYVYGQVKSNSMLHIMNINLNGEAISDTEKNVERDIISLYEAVKTYYNAKEGND